MSYRSHDVDRLGDCVQYVVNGRADETAIRFAGVRVWVTTESQRRFHVGTLDGGDEGDYLAGGAGDDTYLNVDSLDTVDDTEGNNILRFDQSAGLAAGNALSVTDGGATLLVALDNGETIKLQNAPFGMNASLEFSNGDSLDLETLVGSNAGSRLSVNALYSWVWKEAA